jgi:tetratricopeptide (TPR) repeat protein
VKAGRTAAEWLGDGCRFEEAGKVEEAESAYRQALLVGGPDADACFDLANVLRAQAKGEQAAERYYQAVEIEPGHTDAWNNLGVLLAELGRPEEARRALTKAVELDPQSADARYNLADLLDDQGRVAEALPHWQAFLRQGGAGPWMDYARRRVKGLSRA